MIKTFIKSKFPDSDKASEALDKFGATASFLCAIHCAIMPMVIALVPLMALSILASEAVEWVLFGLSAMMATGSVCWGYKKHKSRKTLAVLACGLALLSAGRILHHHHNNLDSKTVYAKASSSHQEHDEHQEFDLYSAFLVVGGIMVTASHMINYRLCKTCKKCFSENS
jgi:hypothetical protein